MVPKLFRKVQFGTRTLGMFNLVPNFLKRFNLVLSVKLELTPCPYRTRVKPLNLNFIFIFFFKKINFFFQKIKNYHVSVYHRATWQLTIMTCGSVIVIFNLVPNLNFWFNLVPKFFKMIQFRGLTRVLYGHGVNSNLTERTKLNLFRKLGYQIEHSQSSGTKLNFPKKFGYQMCIYTLIFLNIKKLKEKQQLARGMYC